MLETDSTTGPVVNNATIVNLPLKDAPIRPGLLAPGVRKSFLGMDQSSSNYRESSF